MDKSLSRTRIELLLLFGLYLILLPRVYMDYDMGFWREWALKINQYGLPHAYDHGINYFPVSLYLLYFYDWLQGSPANIAAHINNIKIFFIFFDFLPIFVLCGFRQKILSFNIPYLYLLINIAYVFNSMIWGQVDSIYTNICFLSIITGLFYPVTSIMLYTLALNTKPQAIEFLPVLGIVWLYSVRSYKTVALGILSVVSIQLVIMIPFFNTGGMSKLIYFAGHSVDLYNKLSISAFNIWYLITPGNPYFINDKDVFVLVSYKTFGLVLFSCSAIITLLPLFRKFLRLRKEQLKPDTPAYSMLFLGTGMLCLFFFYFNSQMHERYANPIIIFFFFYGVASGNYRLYILASIPYFLSLDKSFPDYLPVVHYKFIFASKVIALWYTTTVIYGSNLYYRLMNTKSPVS